MDAHGVDVFDGTDDDAVVFVVAHDLQLEFFPAFDTFFDQDFIDRAGVQTAPGQLLELLLGFGDAGTMAAEDVGRTDNDRQADFIHNFTGFFGSMSRAGSGDGQADFLHGFFELLAVFGGSNGFRAGANQGYFILL